MERLLNNRDGTIIDPKTYVSYERKGDILTFAFEAYDSSLNSFSDMDNDALYNGDVVEVFLDLGDEYYYEFEVAPNGATFVATIMDAKPTFIDPRFFSKEVMIKGNDYFVQMTIDLSALPYRGHIKFNAFRIETKGIRPNHILQALSPTLSETFHVKDAFIKL